jgi:hypothetical protein
MTDKLILVYQHLFITKSEYVIIYRWQAVENGDKNQPIIVESRCCILKISAKEKGGPFPPDSSAGHIWALRSDRTEKIMQKHI